MQICVMAAYLYQYKTKTLLILITNSEDGIMIYRKYFNP